MVNASCSCGFTLESLNTVKQIIGLLQHCDEKHPENFFPALKAMAKQYGDWPDMPEPIQLYRYPRPGEEPPLVISHS